MQQHVRPISQTLQEALFAGSLASLSRIWAAIGGTVGLVLMAVPLMDGWLPPVIGVVVGFYIALAVAYNNVSKQCRLAESSLEAVKGTRPRLEFDRAAHGDLTISAVEETTSGGGDEAINVWQLWFLNRPEKSSKRSTARNLTARVEVCDGDWRPVIDWFVGQWAITRMPHHRGWRTLRPAIDLHPVYEWAKLVVLCQNYMMVDREDGSSERGVYAMSGENLYEQPTTADHHAYFLDARCTRLKVNLSADNMDEQEFRFALVRSADGTVTSIAKL